MLLSVDVALVVVVSLQAFAAVVVPQKVRIVVAETVVVLAICSLATSTDTRLAVQGGLGVVGGSIDVAAAVVM